MYEQRGTIKMKMRVFQDRVRVIAFLGCFLTGFAAFPVQSAPICDTGLEARIRQELEKNVMAQQDLLNNTIPIPADRDQIANSPCMSQQLDGITAQFSNSASGLGNIFGGFGSSGAGSDVLNGMFSSGFTSLNNSMKVLPDFLSSFQTQASKALGDLIGNLKNVTGFNLDPGLCGMMVDMIIGFVQCQNPIQLPDLPNLSTSLNFKLPGDLSCPANKTRNTVYDRSLSQKNENWSQPIDIDANGHFGLGKSELNENLGR